MQRASAFWVVLCGVVLTGCTDWNNQAAPGTPVEPRVQRDVEVIDEDLGNPIPGLNGAQLAAFFRGKDVFERTFTDANGLGPTFNASSCAECHGEPEDGGVTGAGGDEVETHFSRWYSNQCDAMNAQGGFVHQDSITSTLFSLGYSTPEPFPNTRFYYYQMGTRTTPDVFGFGLLSLVPDNSIRALADPNDLNRDGVSGRVHQAAGGAVGRFGRKAQEPNLNVFNTNAFHDEMGVTTNANIKENTYGSAVLPARADPARDPELSDADLADLNAFMLFLAPPSQLPATTETLSGQRFFSQIGCANCHVPTLTTGNNIVAALRNKPVRAFTDLLLHDMGEQQDICLGNADEFEFRTEPLMGARFNETFMHDGRASTVEEAIQLHGGEGSRARSSFDRLTPTQKAAVVAYVLTL